MASPRFDIPDYVRIVSHRILWLVLPVALAGAVAFMFLCCMESRYRSSMEVMVYQRIRNNPYLQKIIPPESMSKIINSIRERIRSEGQLSLMTHNLRLVAKNDYCRRINMAASVSSSQREDLGKFLSSLPPDNMRLFFGRMELVTLGKIAGCLESSAPFGMAGEERDGCSVSEYLVDGEGSDAVIKQMRTKLGLPQGNLQEALLQAIIKASEQPDWLEKMPDARVLEIAKEVKAADYLDRLNLFNVLIPSSYHGLAESSAYFWIDKLRQGLTLGQQSAGNTLRFNFDMTAKSKDAAIPHLVVNVVQNMVRASYYATEIGYYVEAEAEILKQIETMQKKLMEVENGLSQKDKILQLSMAYAESNIDQMFTRRELSARDENFAPPRASVHVRRLNTLEEDRRAIMTDIDSCKKQIEMVASNINDPRNATKRTTVFSTIDSAEVTKLKQQKILLEKEIRDLLVSATEAHPSVKRKQREISEVDSQLSSLGTPLSQEVLSANPQIDLWKKEKDDLEKKKTQLESRLAANEKAWEAERKLAEDAPAALREYENLRQISNHYTGLLEDRQKRLEDLRADQLSGSAAALTTFEVSLEAMPPTAPYAPRAEAVIGIGLLIGLLTAIAAVFFLEYTDHSLKDVNDVKRFFDIPVVGRIPNYNFEQMEVAALALAGVPVADKAKRGGRRSYAKLRRRLRTLIVLALLGGAGYYAWTNYPESIRNLAYRAVAELRTRGILPDESHSEKDIFGKGGSAGKAEAEATGKSGDAGATRGDSHERK